MGVYGAGRLAAGPDGRRLATRETRPPPALTISEKARLLGPRAVGWRGRFGPASIGCPGFCSAMRCPRRRFEQPQYSLVWASLLEMCLTSDQIAQIESWILEHAGRFPPGTLKAVIRAHARAEVEQALHRREFGHFLRAPHDGPSIGLPVVTGQNRSPRVEDTGIPRENRPVRP